MNELKQEDVMRALECCMNGGRCNKCPIYDESECECYLGEKVLALLREKDAKIADCIRQIADMQAEIAAKDSELTALMKCKHIEADKDAEIERLKKASKNLSELGNGWIVTGCKNIRSEAITEFAERLKQAAYGDCTITGYKHYIVDVADIDQIAQEMKGEGHGEK